MKVADSLTQWAKVGQISKLCFIGREVIFFGAGCHLVFYNIPTEEELIYVANNCEIGDGIRCYEGHRTQNIFAFVENCTNPKIFVKTFPEFEIVCELKDGAPRGYIEIVFSDTSLLLTLGDLPNFNLTVWNWRRGEKVASKDTDILTGNQMLRCSKSTPVYAAQLGIGTNNLNLWDIFICSKTCIVAQHVVTCPENSNPFTDILWTTEGGFFVLDSSGCVYMMLPDYELEKVVDSEISGDRPTSLIWYKSGLAVAGPNNEIRHYKKSGSWSLNWNIKPPEILLKAIARLDYLIVVSDIFNILLYDHAQNEFKYIRNNASSFTDFCLIYPTGDYVLALCHNDTLNLFEVATGVLISTKSLNGKALVLLENPKFPYAAIGYEDGNLELISAYKPEKLVKLTKFYLHKDPINSIYFNDCGTVFVAANTTIGRFFIIEGLPGGEMEILATVNANQQIVDYMMVISHNCYRIFVIPTTSKKYLMGDKIIRYCVIRDKTTNIKEYTFENENSFYTRIYGTSLQNRDRAFYAVPYGNKTIHEIEIKRGVDFANVTSKINTGHQLGNVHLNLNKQFALTWAYDGFIVLRDSFFARNIGIALPHHRMNGGVKKAYADPCEKYLISLGYDNVLVCTTFIEKEIRQGDKQDLIDLLESATYEMLFKNKTVGFAPKGELEGKCYLEVLELQQIEKEYIRCRKERESILKEFKLIQQELQELLTINLEGPDNEKLDLLEFNLDTKLYEQKANYNKKLRKATEIYLKKVIEAQNNVSKYILEHFWERMGVTGTVIKAIFANFDISNYVVRPLGINTQELYNLIKQQRKLERYLTTNDHFKPWRPIPQEELINLLTEKPSLPSQDEEMTNLAKVHEEEAPKESLLDSTETKITFFGSDLARFIELEDIHYFQSELQTYYQTETQMVLSKYDSQRVKEYFNKFFDDLMIIKVKEMSSIKDRNDRLRYIVSEINYHSVEKMSIFIDDPQWEQTERPQEIKEVKDNEVPITPYISPSEQAILDAKAAEAERLRLLLLADDFRERALMAMMNGVLEVRWEDELKKDVPLPKCMIEKDPEQFNEDDLRAVKDYEEKVKFLQSERDRYKGLLEIEYSKVANSVRESIKKFNGKLSDLILLKMKIDSAVSQETLKVARIKLINHKHSVLLKRQQEVQQRISDNDNMIWSLNKLLVSLHNAMAECRNYQSSLEVKDRILERAFKKDFQDMSTVVQEQALKLYRKRPKINIRGLNSTTLLTELAKCITSNYRPLLLSQECFEFLKSLENMDMYIGIPSIVDEPTYTLICKHRRLRVEFEIKAKAAHNQIVEGEVTVAAFQKKLTSKKELSLQLNTELSEIRSEMLELERNMEIQIVIPTGLVEIQLTGNLLDFNDAVLICRKDVEDINRIISSVGDEKLKALQRTMGFRRKILAQEWEHKKLRMQIQDLQEKIVDISNVRLTKEIQMYLKASDKEKNVPFEIEVDMIKASYENTIQDRREQVKRMQKQIQAIRKQDEILDQKITAANVDVCEFNLLKDHELDSRVAVIIESRMKVLLRRSKLVKQIQEKHHEILMLQTELELLRLKTFPTIKYKILT